MKLRIAIKIWKAIGTPREAAYTGAQQRRAIRRYDRLKSAKEDTAYWHAMLKEIGVAGRVQVLLRGAPDMAFALLMETPVEEW